MLTNLFLVVLTSITGFSAAAANIPTPLNSNFEIRNAPGTSPEDTVELLRRSLTAVALKRATDDVYKTNATLDTSWDDQFLFKLAIGVESGKKGVTAGVSVTCSTCYIKGFASAEFIIQEGFSFNKTFSNITDQIKDSFEEITNITVAYAKAYKDQFIDTTLTLSQENVTVGDYFDLPPLNVDLNFDIPDVPDCELQFKFDGLEVYMELDTVLSLGATYTINLFTSQTPFGIKVGDKLEVGFTFTLDLILDVQAPQIDIRSGFHIKLDDGIAFNLPMFSKKISNVTFNGGNFEFLDVSIESGGITFKAILRVGVRAGLGLSTPKLGDLSAGASIVGQFYVDVAQFKTTISDAPITIKGKACELSLVQEYALAIGASVGYLFEFKEHAWGPILDTETAIFETTLTEICLNSRTSSAVTSSATVKARQAFLTETTTTEISYTAVQCQSSGLTNCPASLQTVITDKFDSVLTATLASSGADPVWTTKNTAAVTTIPFKTALRMDSTSGAPVPYTPGPTSTSTVQDVTDKLNEKTGGVSNKLILGVSLGVGVPLLIAFIAGFVFLIKRKRAASRKSVGSVEPYEETVQVSEQIDSKKGAAVNVVEYRG